MPDGHRGDEPAVDRLVEGIPSRSTRPIGISRKYTALAITGGRRGGQACEYYGQSKSTLHCKSCKNRTEGISFCRQRKGGSTRERCCGAEEAMMSGQYIIFNCA